MQYQWFNHLPKQVTGLSGEGLPYHACICQPSNSVYCKWLTSILWVRYELSLVTVTVSVNLSKLWLTTNQKQILNWVPVVKCRSQQHFERQNTNVINNWHTCLDFVDNERKTHTSPNDLQSKDSATRWFWWSELCFVSYKHFIASNSCPVFWVLFRVMYFSASVG